jgi:flavin reductase (DIM6/NTAB) family NADH-FMN oxidoreductase RutF
MAKKTISPTTLLFPLPVVLVTCKDELGRESIITISFISIVNSDPPMIGIAVRPNRYSHDIIKKSGEFAVNIPSEDLLKITDYCGVASGKDVNKYTATQLTPIPSKKVKVPSIQECPVNIECVVKQVLHLGSHDFFVGEIVSLQADEEVLRPNQSSVDIQKILPFSLSMGGKGALEYWGIRCPIGTYGFTKGEL